MKCDNNKYELKTYIINKTNEYIEKIVCEENDSLTSKRYEEALKVLKDVRSICDKRNRY